ncbi:MAG: orotidine-5'-phosphate decarboxylase [PVC group bacterium]|nr:orotidine-5'-phosphate decarboxylase [PVC group bacterium]
MKKNTELIVALDTESLDEARSIVDKLSGVVRFFKIGSQLFTAAGPIAVEMVRNNKAEVFLDLKFHDIPNTVANAAISSIRLGISMFNVHAMGGKAMLIKTMEAVNAECEQSGVKKPIVLGVTVLTSMDRQQLNSIGVARSVKNQVGFLAKLCQKSGLDGVVCSGKEIKLLRRITNKDFILVVPGVRPKDSLLNDQKRVITPTDAVRLGADFIVVGRPIVANKDPSQAAKAILQEIQAAASLA